MIEQNEFDVCVIGSGPGGYVAAIRASQLGLKVAIVEKEAVGGVCLNYGCIPTKALLHCADQYRNIKNAYQIGINVGSVSFDFSKIAKHAKDTVSKLTSGVKGLLRKNKITLFEASAKFIDKTTLSLAFQDSNKNSTIKAKYFIIATGSRARKIDSFNINENEICTYRGVMNLNELPGKVVIIGGGVIGVEFASFYNAFGSDVVIIESADRILQNEDKEISEKIHDTLTKDNINILTKCKVNEVKKENNCVKVILEQNSNKKEIITQKVIVSIGVQANIDNIGIENILVKLEAGYIKTDEYCKTNVDNIYAIGDVTSGPWLAHKASHEGIVAAEAIAFEMKKSNKNPHEIQKLNIASCIYCYPQIASIGLTEEKARELGYKIKIGRFSYFGNGKALATQDHSSFVKVIFDEKTQELLGVHIIGKQATEIISTFSVAKEAELVKDDFIRSIFPHPTISEMIHEAILDSDSRAIHN
jgi:dihydrolipoamide dehydrogenase